MPCSAPWSWRSRRPLCSGTTRKRARWAQVLLSSEHRSPCPCCAPGMLPADRRASTQPERAANGAI